MGGVFAHGMLSMGFVAQAVTDWAGAGRVRKLGVRFAALVVTTGPVVTPFFLAYGLRRGAYIATESVCALGMNVTRGAVLARYALLTWDTIAVGCVLGGTMFAGAWIGRRLLERMSERAFLVVIEALLVVMGLHFLLVPR